MYSLFGVLNIIYGPFQPTFWNFRMSRYKFSRTLNSRLRVQSITAISSAYSHSLNAHSASVHSCLQWFSGFRKERVTSKCRNFYDYGVPERDFSELRVCVFVFLQTSTCEHILCYGWRLEKLVNWINEIYGCVNGDRCIQIYFSISVYMNQTSFIWQWTPTLKYHKKTMALGSLKYDEENRLSYCPSKLSCVSIQDKYETVAEYSYKERGKRWYQSP